MDNTGYIEGRNPVMEALKAGRDIEKIFIEEGNKSGSIIKIKQIAKDRGIVTQYVHKNKLQSMADTQSHQGVIALVSSHSYKNLEDILKIAKEREEDPFIIILDEIKDPHNLGSIMRTAECVGAHGIIIPKRRSVGLTATVGKTSAGAIEYMPVVKVPNIASIIDVLKEKGIWIYGADMSGEENYYNTNLTGPIGVVIGSEGSGMSRLVKEKCDVLVRIPMKGNVSSLNASVAGSIIMYDVLRQRGMKK
ncbi:23S rRNA (guanosine(2251)-2'-O)-methyltransferase RlmB [Clostridium sp. D2Q-11]|uniref:23S rRNA (Guanosine(2251)-2'-O)-methyltransferase RlmB n=1 Tax=Anaeromonas frigoriresistens TaxID=2683708 RepID=A0A942UWG1_9FIRM|nr:23S rRNA (guanosine(2251)-2'-O)-methyltransferase RlmB [Anaeromonas frigoriresistens]MBS4536862.1 23S rRNA (guanosine(2251)-2'-O)-methyltransferase RlmB [Anaeromonas frigoriresistens]